jgi:hypothetical protein
VLFVMLKISKAGEQIHGKVHRSGAHRESAHIAPHQRHVRRTRAPEEGAREVEADGSPPGRGQGPRVTAGTATDVEHPPPRLPGHRPGQQRDRAVRLRLITMGVDGEVVLVEPIFKPLRQRSLPLWYGSPRRMVPAR